jgi:hypothetical protein
VGASRIIRSKIAAMVGSALSEFVKELSSGCTIFVRTRAFRRGGEAGGLRISRRMVLRSVSIFACAGTERSIREPGLIAGDTYDRGGVITRLSRAGRTALTSLPFPAKNTARLWPLMVWRRFW